MAAQLTVTTVVNTMKMKVKESSEEAKIANGDASAITAEVEDKNTTGGMSK